MFAGITKNKDWEGKVGYTDCSQWTGKTNGWPATFITNYPDTNDHGRVPPWRIVQRSAWPSSKINDTIPPNAASSAITKRGLPKANAEWGKINKMGIWASDAKEIKTTTDAKTTLRTASCTVWNSCVEVG